MVKTSKLWSYLLLLGLLALAVLARLYNLNSPPFDQFAHSFRQSQTLSTIEDFYRNGINIYYPKANYVGYPGYFVLELPLFQALAAFVWRLLGPSVAYVRLLNIIFGLAGGYFTYEIAKKLFGRDTALYALVIFLFMPLNIMYQRSTLIEPLAVLFSLAAVYLTLRYQDNPRGIRLGIAIFIVYAIAGLLKPLYLFPVLALLAVDFFRNRRWPYLPGLSLALTALAYIAWIRHSSSINAASYFTESATITRHLGLSALANPTYYAALAWRTLNNYLNPVGFFFILLLYLSWTSQEAARKRNIFLLAVIIGPYLLLFANINRPHNYYQLVVMPYVAILAAVGLDYLRGMVGDQSGRRLVSALLISFVVASGFTFIAGRLSVLDPNLVSFQSVMDEKLDDDGYTAILAGVKSANTLGNAFGLQKNNVYSNQAGFLYAAQTKGIVFSSVDPEKTYEYLANIYPHFQGRLQYIIVQDLEKNPTIMSKPLAKKLRLSLIHRKGSTFVYEIGHSNE